jgi:hypothetical protein
MVTHPTAVFINPLLEYAPVDGTPRLAKNAVASPWNPDNPRHAIAGLLQFYVYYEPSRASSLYSLASEKDHHHARLARLVSEQHASVLVYDEPKNLMLGSLGSLPTLSIIYIGPKYDRQPRSKLRSSCLEAPSRSLSSDG